jgi:3-dehydroquinate dehydratase-2
MASPKEIYVINGPNLGRLGSREPDIYGKVTLADIEKICTEEAAEYKAKATMVQSDAEHEIIKAIHKAIDGKAAGIIINAGAFTHTSVAIRDALAMAEMPVVEVHLSNIYGREEFRHHSHISGVAKGVISGFGAASYRLAVKALMSG